MPRLSVLIPSYGHEAYLRQAIESVQAQTWTDWEIVLVDDRSPDGSWALAQELAASEPRLKVHQNEANLGSYGTQQEALNRAEGELIAVLNSDDFWAPDKLAAQVSLLDEHPEAAACFVHGVPCLADGTPVPEAPVWPDRAGRAARYGGSLAHENRILASGVVFRRQGLRFHTSLRYSGDWAALIEANMRGPLVSSAETLTFWRQHDTNSYRLSPKQAWEEIRVRQAIFRQGATFPAESGELEHGLLMNDLNLAALNILFGRMGQAASGSVGSLPLLKRRLAARGPKNWVQRRIWPQVEDFSLYNPPQSEPDLLELQAYAP
jgi:glycosyltransferase involved in cell wall biosynthesis